MLVTSQVSGDSGKGERSWSLAQERGEVRMFQADRSVGR